MVDGAEAELQSAAGVSGHGIPLELWDVPTERRDGEGDRLSSLKLNCPTIRHRGS